MAAALTGAAGLALGPGVGAARAQPQLNPVYVDDSPVATDTFSRVKDFLAAGNIDETVRVLQVLLDEHADRLIAAPGESDVFVSVRSRVHAELLGNARLLERYRELQGPRAQALLESSASPLNGAVDEINRSLLLTGAGFESGLRLAQRQLEQARFEAARLTLEELDTHPDRTPGTAGARDAARLYAAVARFIDRAEVWAVAERWASQDQADAPARAAQAWPERATRAGLSPLGELPAIDPQGLISKPLWTIDVQAPNPLQVEPALGGTGRAGATIPVNARELTLLPTVSDDLLIVNDGVSVTAIDRFTLSARWTIQPSPTGGAGGAAGGEDDEAAWRGRMWGNSFGPEPLTVTVRGGYGAAATGRASGNGREGDDRIHGLDPRTGRLRWTVVLGQLDASLAESTVRGPLEIDEGVVVAAVRKHLPDRRLMSLSLVGLDAETGALKWIRMVGSAGWLPFAPNSFGPAATAVSRGVAYRADELGAVAAVAVESGRTLWVRRMPVETATSMRDTSRPWEVNRPVIDGDSVVFIAPDQRRITRLGAARGELLAERQASQFGSPLPTYLLRAGPLLAAVGPNRIALAPLAAFDTAPVRLTPQVEDPGIWGRVSVVGDRLLVPLVKGLALIDPARPDADPIVQPLDRPGNVLALGKQLLVVDDVQAHSYLQWDVAESILADRMKADPADPTPAVTFAELAYRAGKFDRILPAVDGAVRAIAAEPTSDRNLAQRQRLFETLHAMINGGLEAAEQTAAAARGAAPDGAGAPGPDRPGALPRLSDRAMVSALVEKLAAAAVAADDRVSVALASGRLSDLGGEPARAAAVYQGILDDPAMAKAHWRGPSVSVRAELEAARRLEALIAEHGASIYAAQEAEAERRLAALGPEAGVEDLEALAARYPLSVRTPEIYRRVYQLHKTGGEDRDAVAALEAGLKASQRIPGAPEAAVGELAGQLIVELRERSQASAAASVLRNVRRRIPTIALTAGAQPLDADRIGAELAERIAATTRWPRVGQMTGENVQALSGWTILEPELRESTPHLSNCLVMQADREVAVFAVETQGPRRGELGRLWGRPVADLGVSLIRTTPDAAYLLVTSDVNGGIEKVPLNSATRGWQTEPLGKLFPPGEETRGMQRVPGVLSDSFETPLDGVVPADDLVATMDERTLVLVQRGGRALALDCDSGEVLWRGNTGISQVYDAQLVAGTLVVAGDVRKTTATGAVEELSPAVQVVDARSGNMGERLGTLGQTPDDRPARVRWVRLTESAQLICGTDDAVLSIDLHTAQRNWTVTGPEMMPTTAAWLLGDRLLMLSQDRQMFLASASTGRVKNQPLEAPKSRLESSRQIDAFSISANPDGPFGVSTSQGLMVFSAEGELQGIDGLGGIDTMLPPRPAEDRAIAIETVSEGRSSDGLLQFHMYALEANSAVLIGRQSVLLGARPLAIQLLDGKVAVTAGATTVVINAPAVTK